VGINWGYFYVATQSSPAVTQGIATALNARNTFASSGVIPPSDLQGPKACNDQWPVLATVWNLGLIQQSEEIFAVAAYDDIISIDFFGQKMEGFWTRKFDTITALIAQSIQDYSSIMTKLANFDDKLVADLTRVGGDKYATIASLSYRQVHAYFHFAITVKGISWNEISME
jgi:hypothetical protein